VKPTPFCCGIEASWVNNGPNLQYFYCKECKNEVITAEVLEAVTKERVKINAIQYAQPPNDATIEPEQFDFFFYSKTCTFKTSDKLVLCKDFYGSLSLEDLYKVSWGPHES
jgi:hypothetical protein